MSSFSLTTYRFIEKLLTHVVLAWWKDDARRSGYDDDDAQVLILVASLLPLAVKSSNRDLSSEDQHWSTLANFQLFCVDSAARTGLQAWQ